MLITELIANLNRELISDTIKDYCPNGLQVEGKLDIQKIVTGVTASEALIDKAIALKADAILVHHGYFWKGEKQCILGMKKRRLSKLLANDINLIAYHLPLDVHPSMGNNAELGRILGLQNIKALDGILPKGIVMHGEFTKPMEHNSLSAIFEQKLKRKVISVGSKTHISRLAWCTGGGQNFVDEVANSEYLQVDAFLSGEISEQTTHSAIEQDIDFFALGHHATERYGVKALGEWLAKEYHLDVSFVDIDNPA